jgi:hypothetical protein
MLNPLRAMQFRGVGYYGVRQPRPAASRDSVSAIALGGITMPRSNNDSSDITESVVMKSTSLSREQPWAGHSRGSAEYRRLLAARLPSSTRRRAFCRRFRPTWVSGRLVRR